MIPPFAPTGLLPPGPLDAGFVCTRDEVLDRFATPHAIPGWRKALFEAWDLVREATAEVVPSAVWWLWGCAVSNHAEPLFGDDETLSAVVILPMTDLPVELPRRAMLIDFLRTAEVHHRVDVGIVYQFDSDHPDALFTVEALEWRWRRRASHGIADHVTRELVPAGFLEVQP